MRVNSKHVHYWIILFVIINFRYLYYNYNYFPILDDNSMYGFFAKFKPVEILQIFPDFIKTRPFAVLFDVFFISRIWNWSGLILFIMTVLFFLSCFFLYKVSQKVNIGIGYIAILFFTLNPFGFEGYYWIAASSRLIGGLFFSSLALYILVLIKDRYESGNKVIGLILLFWVSHMISMGFYEQVIAFTFISACALILFLFRPLKRLWILVIPVINLVIMGFYYLQSAGSENIQARGNLLTEGFIKHGEIITEKTFLFFVVKQLKVIYYGALDGISLVVNDKSWWFIAVIIIISALMGLVIYKYFDKNKKQKYMYKIIVGIVLIFVPMMPFYILKTTWIDNRNLFLSIIGLGIVVETIVCFIANKKFLKLPMTFLVSFMLVIMMFGNIAEYANVRNTCLVDQRITSECASMIEQSSWKEKGKKLLFILNTKENYSNILTVPHFSNCTVAGWAFMGAFLYFQPQTDVPSIETIPDGSVILLDIEKIDEYMFHGFDENQKLQNLVAEVSAEEIQLFYSNGDKCGKVKKEQDKYIFEFFKSQAN